ncbi:MAG TPA: T9SS type A sorting domain-containing protein [Ignavibacteriales bacterium]|nr:T9SS type A sorting domain-containing protein [Ignavibacteriales bacterium]
MKLSTVLFLLALLTSAHAQIDTTDFFPMQTGNQWVYKGSNNDLSYFIKIHLTVTITQDWVSPNGEHHAWFHEEYSDDHGGHRTDDYHYWKDSNAVYNDQCPGGTKIFDLSPYLKDFSIWATCRPVRLKGSIIGRGVRFSGEYSDWLRQNVEARSFEEVLYWTDDTLFQRVEWSPFDGSPQETLLQGIGMARLSYLSGASYHLVGAIINGQKFGALTSVETGRSSIPSSMQIQAYPNPFNSTIKLNVTLAQEGTTELTVYNALGQKVATIFENYKPSGSFTFPFNADHLTSGIYFVLLKQGRTVCKEKILLLK